jgi:hypothetical protein
MQAVPAALEARVMVSRAPWTSVRRLAATLARAREFAAEAKRALLVFPASPMRARLMDVADYTVSRAS